MRKALAEPLHAIVETIKDTLERTPPELAADIAQRGIMLAGGGSLLEGFDERLRERDEDATYLADSPSPASCSAPGARSRSSRWSSRARPGGPPPAARETVGGCCAKAAWGVRHRRLWV